MQPWKIPSSTSRGKPDPFYVCTPTNCEGPQDEIRDINTEKVLDGEIDDFITNIWYRRHPQTSEFDFKIKGKGVGSEF